MVPHVLQHIAVVHGHQADDLGHIQRRAAPEADDGVRAMCLVGGSAGHHLRTGGVAEDAVEHGHVQARQVALELRHHGQRGQGAVGDDQGALDAAFQQVRSDELASARAEGDGGGESETVDGVAHGGVWGAQRPQA